MKPKFVYNKGYDWSCPEIIRGKIVRIFFRNGVKSGNIKPEDFFWEKQGVPSDIIAYQIIEDKS